MKLKNLAAVWILALAASSAMAADSSPGEHDKYMGLIDAKIRRNIVMPPNVPDKREVQFVIILLPDGNLAADPKMVKSSGSARYDAAISRAILHAQPLPLPDNPDMRIQFINPNQIRLRFYSRE